MLAEFHPPGHALSFFETFCGMASEGRCNAQGSPPFLQIAASARWWDMYLAGPLVILQRALFAALGPLARIRGYRASYRMHLDLIPTVRGRDEEVTRLLAIGASLVADHRSPDGSGREVMADPEGNEFCVERSAKERGQA